MDLNAIPKQQPDYHLETIEGETILYHLAETRILYLNQTSSLIWGLCDGLRPAGEIIFLLGQAYPEAGDVVETDVMKTLDHFLEAGCIEST